jgi:RHS repeat-associated protein
VAAATLSRGFTLHEHIDHVGLIHMGGQVYDPEIGRFLSPDPFVQFPASTQGFNRYAYVGNNPLSYGGIELAECRHGLGLCRDVAFIVLVHKVVVTYQSRYFGSFESAFLTGRYEEVLRRGPYTRSATVWETMDPPRYPVRVNWSPLVGRTVNESSIQRRW